MPPPDLHGLCMLVVQTYMQTHKHKINKFFTMGMVYCSDDSVGKSTCSTAWGPEFWSLHYRKLWASHATCDLSAGGLFELATPPNEQHTTGLVGDYLKRRRKTSISLFWSQYAYLTYNIYTQ